MKTLSPEEAARKHVAASLGHRIDDLRWQQAEAERAHRDYREKVLGLLAGGVVLALLFGFLARISAVFAVIAALVCLGTALGLATFAKMDPGSVAGREARRIARLIAETETQRAGLTSLRSPDL